MTYKQLNQYYKIRKELETRLQEYDKARRQCSKFMKWENQSNEYLNKVIPDNIEDKHNWYNKNIMPITMKSISEIRKNNEIKCRVLKLEIKELQRKLNQIEKDLLLQ